jgi:hypothetical protein
MSRLPHPPWFNYPNNIGWRIQAMKFIIMQFSSRSSTLSSQKPNYYLTKKHMEVYGHVFGSLSRLTIGKMKVFQSDWPKLIKYGIDLASQWLQASLARPQRHFNCSYGHLLSVTTCETSFAMFLKISASFLHKGSHRVSTFTFFKRRYNSAVETIDVIDFIVFVLG